MANGKENTGRRSFVPVDVKTDEVMSPPELRRAEELAEAAIEAGRLVPPPPADSAAAHLAELLDELNHAGLDDEPDPHENDPAPLPPAGPLTVEPERPRRWSGP